MKLKITPSITGFAGDSDVVIEGQVNNTSSESSSTYIGQNTDTAQTFVDQEERTISVDVTRTPSTLTITDGDDTYNFDGSNPTWYDVKQYRIVKKTPLDPENAFEYVLKRGDVELTPRINIPRSTTSARAYDSIEELVQNLSVTTVGTGTDMYITAGTAPALWVASVEETYVPYVYTSDEDFNRALTTSKDTTLQIGYYKVCKISADSWEEPEIEYVAVEDSGDVTATLRHNQVLAFTSDAITSLTLVLPASPAITFPFYSEIAFSGNQPWASDESFEIVNETGKHLGYIQWNRAWGSYNPITDSSTDASIDLLFYYDPIQQIVCYVNEIPTL